MNPMSRLLVGAQNDEFLETRNDSSFVHSTVPCKPWCGVCLVLGVSCALFYIASHDAIPRGSA
jgi:hypothetical protein